ncbi:hypothetical protein [Streptococcus acidominimus]|uniref:Conjugal transfer protein n=1 Tax=Streptococcus acidominimus TaxID=1326 RepID=A0A4Y9FTM5_STRAI|nr:hypothetical protein [Streptococcus acidominimus]MBF0817875.1 hypothetical protein [Streptococcus acidominimus]MBF0838391.1 hypothetical protein [Streptococcus acidominimus]MBF0846246.1 hypothetical protein [Streptococcus danieliae]TFU31863.1 hypothetical protein E4U01_00135 [Streptococcus acidominimus]
MFEYKDGFFFVKETGQKIFLSDLNSKLLLDTDWYNPMTGIDYVWNSLLNALVWLYQFFFEIIVKIYDILGKNGGEIDNIIIKTIDKNAALFETIYDSLFWYILIILFSYAFYMQVTRRGSALKIICLSMLVMGFVKAMYTAPPEVNPAAYSLSGGVKEEEKARPRTFVSTIYLKVSTTLETVGSNALAGFSDDSPDQVLVTYFEQAIWEPYRGMNADKKEDGNYNLEKEQLIALFGYRDGDEDYEILDKKIKEVVGTKKEPIVKNIRGLGNKFAYVLVGLIEVPLLGMVLVAFSVFSFALKSGILVLFYLLPLLLIASIFPFMWHVFTNTAKTIGKGLVFSNLTGMASALFMLFNATLNSIYLSLTKQDVVVSLVLRLLTYLILWKFRFQIARIFRGQRLAPAGRMLRKLTLGAGTTARKGLGVVSKPALVGGLMAVGAGKIGAEKLLAKQRASAYNRSVQGYMKQGDSFEVATQKTERGQEVRTLRRKEPMKQIRGMGNKTKALAYHLLSKGYRANTAGSQHYGRKQQGALLRVQKDKIDTLDRKQRIKSLDHSIRHQQGIDNFKKNWKQPEQAVIEPSGPMFIDFRNKTFQTQSSQIEKKETPAQLLRKKETEVNI